MKTKLRLLVAAEHVISIAVGFQERVGLRSTDEDAGDPTLVLWDDEGEAVLNLHLDRIDFSSYENARADLFAQLMEDFT